MPIYDEFGSGGTKTNGNIQADVTYKPIISGGTKTNGESHTSAIGSRGTSGGTLLSFQTNWGEAVVFIIRPIIIGAGVEAGNYQGSWGFEWLYIAWPRPRGGTKLDSRSDVWAYYWPPPRNWRGIPYDDTTTARGGIACRKNWPLGVLPIFVESFGASSQFVCLQTIQ